MLNAHKDPRAPRGNTSVAWGEWWARTDRSIFLAPIRARMLRVLFVLAVALALPALVPAAEHVVSLDAAIERAVANVPPETFHTFNHPRRISKVWYAVPTALAISDVGSSKFAFSRGKHEANPRISRHVIVSEGPADQFGKREALYEAHDPTVMTMLKGKAPRVVALTGAIVGLDIAGHPNGAKVLASLTVTAWGGASVLNVTLAF